MPNENSESAHSDVEEGEKATPVWLHISGVTGALSLVSLSRELITWAQTIRDFLDGWDTIVRPTVGFLLEPLFDFLAMALTNTIKDALVLLVLVIAAGFRSLIPILDHRARLTGRHTFENKWIGRLYLVIRFVGFIIAFPLLVLVLAFRGLTGHKASWRLLGLMLMPIWYFVLIVAANYGAMGIYAVIR